MKSPLINGLSLAIGICIGIVFMILVTGKPEKIVTDNSKQSSATIDFFINDTLIHTETLSIECGKSEHRALYYYIKK